MGYAILADEHTERRVARSLRTQGHDVEMVVDVLGPGVSDDEIVARASRTDRLILTSDTDFLAEYRVEEHAGILFQPNDRLPAFQAAAIVTRLSEHLPQDEIHGVLYLTTEWL